MTFLFPSQQCWSTEGNSYSKYWSHPGRVIDCTSVFVDSPTYCCEERCCFLYTSSPLPAPRYPEDNYSTTINTAVLQPLYKTTCVIRRPQLRTGGFLPEQISAVHMPLVMAVSTFVLGRRRYSSPPRCYLHYLHAFKMVSFNELVHILSLFAFSVFVIAETSQVGKCSLFENRNINW